MASYKKTFSIANDFPSGAVETSTLEEEIRASSIETALKRIDTVGDVIDIWFKASLSSGDETILHGDTSSPAGGLLAQHNNAPIVDDTQNVSISNIPYVRNSKFDTNVFSRIYSFSVNICDPTTWYVDSEYVDAELVATATGQTEFYTTHGSGHGCAIVDLRHGKITEENLIVAPTGSYIPLVTVSGVEKTERECYEATGGDYEIDYLSGKITFYEQQYGDVRVSYFHTPSGLGPIFSVAPPAGKKWIIDAAELQVSKDFTMTDTIIQNVFLVHPVYGPIKAVSDVEYKHFANFLDFTYGSYPIVPIVGSGARAMNNDTVIMRWEYLTPLELLSSLQMELRSWSKHGRGFGGERFALTVYGLETDE
jgi:hypothetical protein